MRYKKMYHIFVGKYCKLATSLGLLSLYGTCLISSQQALFSTTSISETPGENQSRTRRMPVRLC